MDSLLSVAAVVAVALAVIAIFVAVISVRIVAQWERMVVKRWGQTNPGLVREPGLRFLIPFMDEGIKVDLREQFIEVPAPDRHHQGQCPAQRGLPDLLEDRRIR